VYYDDQAPPRFHAYYFRGRGDVSDRPPFTLGGPAAASRYQVRQLLRLAARYTLEIEG